MFSCNGKISEKQMRRMLMLSVFTSVILVIPFLSARLLKESIVPGLLVFFALSGLYVLYICGMGRLYEKCKIRTGKEGFVSVLTESGLAGWILTLIQISRMIIRLSFYILLAIAILGEAQVPFMVKTKEELWSNVLVVLPLLLVGVYGAKNHVEKQGRIHEMLFWILFIPFIAMLLFGIREVDYSIFVPQITMSWKSLLKCGYILLVLVIPIEYYLYLRPDLKSCREKNRTGIAVIGIIALGIVLTLFVLGIYGINGAAGEPMTTIAIMRYIRLPFGVLERFDVLMIWFFMIGCFVLICQTLYFVGYIISKFSGKNVSVWVLLLVLVLSLGVVFLVRTYENGLLSFLCYGVWMDIPLSIILPLLGIAVNRLYSKEQKNQEYESRKDEG